MFNTANKITMIRIFSAPVLVALLYLPQTPMMGLICMSIFILAAITDLADGWVARRASLVTNMGKFLDPLADKILVCAVLIMLVQLDRLEAWIVIVMMSREMTVLGLRAMAADRGVVIAADRFGKIKTILQIVAICPLLLHYPLLGFDPRPLGLVLMYAALVLTLFSGGNYVYNFYINELAANKRS